MDLEAVSLRVLYRIAVLVAIGVFVVAGLSGETRAHVDGDPWFTCHRFLVGWLECNAQHTGTELPEWTSCDASSVACAPWDHELPSVTAFLWAPNGQRTAVTMEVGHQAGKRWTVRRVFE